MKFPYSHNSYWENIAVENSRFLLYQLNIQNSKKRESKWAYLSKYPQQKIEHMHLKQHSSVLKASIIVKLKNTSIILVTDWKYEPKPIMFIIKCFLNQSSLALRPSIIVVIKATQQL